MGYMMALAPCFACHRPFSFNPARVPSYQGEPICPTCIARVNARRKETGLPLWPVAPDAYTYCEENEL